MNQITKRSGMAIPGFHFAECSDLDYQSIGEREIRSAYRMFMDTHVSTSRECKRNCRNNPRCVSNLGEKLWFEMEEEDTDEQILELEKEMMRGEGVPAGLRNLGNTCYVNSFLQIWFQNTKFRETLYKWDPGEDPEEQDNESILDTELYEPKGKVASLQALFAMMQYSKRRYVDPTDFICKLGLNPSVQQDAQEFSMLFVSLLEKSLAYQSKEEIRTMIQKLFRGEYAYVTTCLACHKESASQSHFYELDLALAGNKNLAKCLADFLKVEKMTGDEKYFCENCKSKQEAIRCCKLRYLPPVLNLQLNRFQFDMQYGRKKKLNSVIYFPEELDMDPYLEDQNEDSLYYLTGVLMHIGPDANHGHYIAHIQELETGNWFKFSDEYVVQLEKRSSNVNFSGNGPVKKIKIDKMETGMCGGQNSNNAYMLVYMLKSTIREIRLKHAAESVKIASVKRSALIKMDRSITPNSDVECIENEGNEAQPRKRAYSGESGNSIEEVDYSEEYVYENCTLFPSSFPPHLRNKVEKDNMEFLEDVEEKKEARISAAIANNKKKEKMIKMYKLLQWRPEHIEVEDVDALSGEESEVNELIENVVESVDFEFVPAIWLMSWLNDPLTVGPLETRNFLCVHGNIDIGRVVELKLCNTATMDLLVDEHGIGSGPRLTKDYLCGYCVKNKARTISLHYKILRDQQFFKNQLKLPTDGKGFWVGKKSLANWKRLAKVALEDRIISEAQEWQKKKKAKEEVGASADSNPDQDCLASTGTLPNLRPSGQLVGNNLASNLPTSSGKPIDISYLKARLEKMGTNVSLTSGNLTASSASHGPKVVQPPESNHKSNEGQEEASGPDAQSSLSSENLVKAKEEAEPAGHLANGCPEPGPASAAADAKVNFDENLQRKPPLPLPTTVGCSASPVKVKPSCAVRPIMKTEATAVSPTAGKLSAAVRPVIQGQPHFGGELSKCSTTAAQSSDGERDDSKAESGPGHPQDGPEPEKAGLPFSPKMCSVPPAIVPPFQKDCNSFQGQKKAADPLTTGVATTAITPNRICCDRDQFNADIVCPHGNLRIEDRCRQLISREAWFRFCDYFDNPKTFQFGVLSCSKCKEEVSLSNMQKEKWREEATRQKNRLPDLFSDVERPKWSKPSTKRVYLVPANFVLAWRGFIRGLGTGKVDSGMGAITDVNNSLLLCSHGGLLHPPAINWEVEPDPDVVMVREDEWRVIQDMFNVDVEIRVERENTSNGPLLIPVPAACHKCVQSKVEAEQESRLRYTNAIIYVTYLSQHEDLPPSGELQDPEFSSIADNMIGMKGIVSGCEGGVRRSTRRKRARGEKEFVVSSNTLLRDLKVKIMEMFKVAPFDQILFLNGEYLRDNHLNLGQLGILPGSAIFLKADDIPVGGNVQSEEWSVHHPEMGFKGTGLLSS